MTHDELVEKKDNSMTKFLWRLKFVGLMKKRRGYLFSLRDLWEFSDYWFNKADTPEDAVAMFFGRKPRQQSKPSAGALMEPTEKIRSAAEEVDWKVKALGGKSRC